MIRKIIGGLLAGAFILGAVITGWAGVSHWAESGDRESLYVGLLGLGAFGLIGGLMLYGLFRKPRPQDPDAAAASIWAVGIGSNLGDGGGGGGSD